MPTRDLFEPSSEDQISARIRALKPSDKMAQDFNRADEYSRGIMRADVERALLDRYHDTQTGSVRNEGVQPATIPITEKFLDETATLYTQPFTHELVDADGNVDDAATEALKRMLDDSGYDAAMHQLERRLALMQSAGVWYQARAGKLRVVSYSPHKLDGVQPDERTWFHPGDQADYQAFVTELREPGQGGSDEGEYAYVERAQMAFYQARQRNQPGPLDIHANPFVWPQAFDTDDLRGGMATLPIMMTTAWHDRLPEQQILPDVDIPIVDLNRELNIQWSMLLDTISHQGWTTLAANVVDPSAPPSTMQMGPRNVVVLGPGEAISAIDSATNYAGLVAVLQSFLQTLAQSKNLSPSDFALDATAPASGFAKLLDMLPKLDARRKFGERMARQEERLAWPRLAVIGLHLGYFTGSVEQLAQLKLRVHFADLEIPRSVDEEAKRLEFDLKHGLTSPARILSEREGITIEEAQARIDENRPARPEPGPSTPVPPTDARSGRAAGLLGNLIGAQASPRPS